MDKDSHAPVHRAMADTGYLSNPIEATRRSANAGPAHLVINELRKPFFTGCAKSKQMTLSTRGRATVIANTNEAPVLVDQVAADHGVSAPALSPAHRTNEGNFGAAPGAGVPAIQVLWQVDTRTSLFPYAAPGYPDDSRLVTGPLLAMGVLRIVFVGRVEGFAKLAERLSGFLAPSVQSGLPQTILPSRPFRCKMATLLTGPAFDLTRYINAAPQVNDLVGLSFLNEFAKFYRPVRRDVSLVSFDTIEDSGPLYSIFLQFIAIVRRRAAISPPRSLPSQNPIGAPILLPEPAWIA